MNMYVYDKKPFYWRNIDGWCEVHLIHRSIPDRCGHAARNEAVDLGVYSSHAAAIRYAKKSFPNLRFACCPYCDPDLPEDFRNDLIYALEHQPAAITAYGCIPPQQEK